MPRYVSKKYSKVQMMKWGNIGNHPTFGGEFGKLANKGADEIRQEVSKRLDY